MNPDEAPSILEAAMRVLVIYRGVDPETLGGQALAELDQAVRHELTLRELLELDPNLKLLRHRWGWTPPRPTVEVHDTEGRL